MIGQIIGNISDLYKVKYDGGYINCKARGKFKNQNIKPLVGDKVIFDMKQSIIDEILPRKNELLRPPICNIDQALIIMSAKEPNYDLYLLDKMISIIEYNNIDVIICFTKLDLLDKEEAKEIDNYIKYYQSIGYKVVKNTELKKIYQLLKDKITTVTGQSGVGKSTLLNKLDTTLNLKTDGISHAMGRGKHTTKHISLLEIKECLIADTPGFSSLSFNEMTKENIRDMMIEANKYKEGCKYRDCFHIKEDDCQIKALVAKNIILASRYNNYKRFIQEKDEDNDKNSRFNFIKK